MNKVQATTMAEVTAVAVHGSGFIPTSSVALMLMNENGLLATLGVDASPLPPPNSGHRPSPRTCTA